MAGRARAWWTLGSFLLLLATVHAEGPTTLTARLQTIEPLHIGGEVRFVTQIATQGFSFRLPLLDRPTDVLEFSSGSLDIYERSYRIVNASDQALVLESPVHFEGQGPGSSISVVGPWRIHLNGEYKLRDASIAFQQREADGFLGGGKRDHAANARLGSQSKCDIMAPLQESPGKLDPQAVAREGGPVAGILERIGISWTPPVYVGRLACATDQFKLSGATYLTAWGGTVWANFTDVYTGSPRSLRIETGTSFSVNQSAPNVIDRTDRWAYFNASAHPSSDMEIVVGADTPLRIEASTAHAFGVGRLHMPLSPGRMEWGDARINGTVPATSVDGTFDFDMATARQVGILGVTSGTAPASGAAIGPDGEEPDAWILASAVGGVLAVLTVGGSLLFTRLTKVAALSHPRRQAIVEFLTVNPGARLKELTVGLGLSRAVVRHHLEHLEQQGVIVMRRYGRRTAAFVAGVTQPADQEALARTRAGAWSKVLKAVASIPDANQRALCEATGLSQPYVSQVLEGLRRERLVCVRMDGPRRIYEIASERVRSLL